jgi:PhoPQ-activated pathogenicity-related protein
MKRLVSLLAIVGGLWGPSWGVAAGELDDYVRREDPSFAWSVTQQRRTPAGSVTEIALVSQTWQEIPWRHGLRVYEAPDVAYPDAMLLFITGGSTSSEPKPQDDLFGLGLSKISGVRVAVLPQVPNQPLLGGKSEDTLIAETFVRYLETKDASWPLLFPMAKSAVRAMDALEAWAKQEKRPVPARFVVAGASKRGWTTWLTGAVDRRVVAIAPMVIDTLNFEAQKAHYLEVWGKPSVQIKDYTERGLDNTIDSPAGKRLWTMVDPHTYRDRLTLPKLLINGTNDPYWTLDALNVYWGDLKGPKSVVYLPNAGHNLAVNRDYALTGLGALVRHSVTGRAFPALTWTHADTDDGALRLSVVSDPPAHSARAWVARSDTRDFRQARWESIPLARAGDDAPYQVEVARPETGYIALFGDLEHGIDDVRYHLSTQIRQTGAKR